MKRKASILMSIVMLLTMCVVNGGCGNEGDNGINKIIELPTGNYEFNKNILIGYGFEMILMPDGSIIARGENSNGELGNGTLNDSEEWVYVEGMTDVIQIVYDGWTSTVIYALKEDGTVWWWGNEQTVPIQIDGLNNITKLSFKNWGSGDHLKNYGGCAYAHNDLGQMFDLKFDLPFGDYEIVFDGIQMDSFVSLISDYSPDYDLYIYNGDLYEYDEDNGTSTRRSGIENLKEIYDFNGRCIMLTDEGEVYTLNQEGIVTSNGGHDVVKKYAIIQDDRYYFNLSLFSDGSISTTGDNKWGELGNGTTGEDYNDWWNVEIPAMKDAYSSLNGNVFTIDKENNIWAWGADYSNEPEIQYNIDKIVNEFY